jgi:hypothetical protein
VSVDLQDLSRRGFAVAATASHVEGRGTGHTKTKPTMQLTTVDVDYRSGACQSRKNPYRSVRPRRHGRLDVAFQRSKPPSARCSSRTSSAIFGRGMRASGSPRSPPFPLRSRQTDIVRPVASRERGVRRDGHGASHEAGRRLDGEHGESLG